MDRELKPGEEYTCARCGGVFEATADPDVAVREYEEYFGRFDVTTMDVVCDDCWNVVHPGRN